MPRPPVLCTTCGERIPARSHQVRQFDSRYHHTCAVTAGIVQAPVIGRPRTDRGAGSPALLVRLSPAQNAALRAAARRCGVSAPQLVIETLQDAGVFRAP